MYEIRQECLPPPSGSGMSATPLRFRTVCHPPQVQECLPPPQVQECLPPPRFRNVCHPLGSGMSATPLGSGTCTKHVTDFMSQQQLSRGETNFKLRENRNDRIGILILIPEQSTSQSENVKFDVHIYCTVCTSMYCTI